MLPIERAGESVAPLHQKKLKLLVSDEVVKNNSPFLMNTDLEKGNARALNHTEAAWSGGRNGCLLQKHFIILKK